MVMTLFVLGRSPTRFTSLYLRLRAINASYVSPPPLSTPFPGSLAKYSYLCTFSHRPDPFSLGGPQRVPSLLINFLTYFFCPLVKESYLQVRAKEDLISEVFRILLG